MQNLPPFFFNDLGRNFPLFNTLAQEKKLRQVTNGDFRKPEEMISYDDELNHQRVRKKKG